MYAGANLGIAIVEWTVYRGGLQLWMLVVSGLISLVMFNTLIFFIFRGTGSSKT